MTKKSEIQQELEENYQKMKRLIETQTLKVGDAQEYLERYYNIIRKMEDLEKSRDNWRDKYNGIKG